MSSSAVPPSAVVGQNLSALRQAVGLTQAELGEAMATLGFPWYRQTVAEVEAGRRSVTLEEVVALASFFDLRPQVLLTTPGGQPPYSAVRLGDRTLPLDEWIRLWAGGDDTDRRKAIDRLMRGVARPWTKLWRKAGGHPAEPFERERQRRLAKRRAFPGPIFLSQEHKTVTVARPPWARSATVVLKAGVPYVARDEIEAAVLEAQEGVFRISRKKAYQLRKRTGGSPHGTR